MEGISQIVSSFNSVPRYMDCLVVQLMRVYQGAIAFTEGARVGDLAI